MDDLKRLIAEIHRRSVWQVLVVYVFGTWICYEVILALVEGLALPGWLPGLAIVLFVIGLPIVVATAMVQEGAPSFRTADLHLLDDLELAGDEEPDGGAEAAPVSDVARAAAGDPGVSQESASSLHRIFTWRNAFTSGVLGFALWGVVAAAWLAFGGARGIAVPAGDAVDAGTSAVAGSLRAVAEPPGTAVRVVALADEGPDSVRVGEAPATIDDLAPGEYRVVFEQPGYHPLELLARVEGDSTTTLRALLTPARPETVGMVRVSAGSAGTRGSVDVPFLMDRTEVTNDDYLEFIAAGGYQTSEYWPDTLVLDGEPLARGAALRRLVDQTGIQAPRGWSGGIYPEGKSEHPVVGVTWYEAAAYARWANKDLPTLAQWWRAAVGDDGRLMPWGDAQTDIQTRANFSLVDTHPAGSLPAGLSPFGLADMAGNVREWLRDDGGDSRPVVGGSWLDPTYMFEQVEEFAPGFASNAVGFRGVRALAATRQEE
jgi:formylglycine-generating enzyme required for sulfatase activity